MWTSKMNIDPIWSNTKPVIPRWYFFYFLQGMGKWIKNLKLYPWPVGLITVVYPLCLMVTSAVDQAAAKSRQAVELDQKAETSEVM